MLFHKIDERNSRFGDSEIVLVVASYFAAAFHAGIFVVSEIYVPRAQVQFEIPSGRQDPLIAVAESAPISETFVPVIFQFRQSSYGNIPSPHVVFAREGMHPEEMSVETFA